MAMKWFFLFESKEAMEKAIPPNTLRKATVESQKICLINHNGVLKATDDLCPHQKASLSEGRLNNFNEIICPLHGYRFDLHNGRENQQNCPDLEIHTIEEKADGIYLGIYL